MNFLNLDRLHLKNEKKKSTMNKLIYVRLTVINNFMVAKSQEQRFSIRISRTQMFVETRIITIFNRNKWHAVQTISGRRDQRHTM